MYHEEKMIDGVLYWRGMPDGEFVSYGIKALSAKILELQEEVTQLEYELIEEYPA